MTHTTIPDKGFPPAQHTPGPWKVERHPTKYPDLFEWSIGQTYQHDGEPHRYGIISGIDSEADARLMAAAPELLAALKAVDLVFARMNQPSSAVHGPDCLGDDEHEAWGLVKAAIAAAEQRKGEKE